MHDALRRLPRLLLLLTLIGLLYVAASVAEAERLVAPLDDAYIHLQYARNVAAGEGMAYQAGEGYNTGNSAPLYLALIAPVFWFADGPVVPLLWTHFVNLLCTAWGIALGAVLAVRIDGRARVGAVAEVVLLSCGALAFGTMSGMEIGPTFALFMTAALGISSERAGERWAGRLAVAVLPLIRPEALGLTALYVALDALGSRRDHGQPRTLHDAAAAVALFPGLAMLGVNRMLLGTTQTAGFAVKGVSTAWEFSGGEAVHHIGTRVTEVFSRMFLGSGELLPPLALVLAGIGAGAALSSEDARLRRVGLLVAVWAVGVVGLLALNIAPSDHHWRYAQPYIGLFIVAAVVGASRMATWFTRHEDLAWKLLVAALICVQLGWSIVWIGRYATLCRALSRMHFRTAEAIAALEPGARLAVHDAGVVPYVTGLPTVDFVGLGTTGFAASFRAGRASTFEALERLDDARYPTLIASFPAYMPDEHCAETLLRIELSDSYFGIRRMDVCRTHSPRREPLDVPLRSIPQHVSLVRTIDVADVESEAAASYELTEASIAFREAQLVAQFGPADAPGFDGGRTVYHAERFAVELEAGKPWYLVSRVSGDGGAVSAAVSALGVTAHLGDGTAAVGEFVAELPAPAQTGQVEVVVAPLARPYLSMHHWVYQ